MDHPPVTVLIADDHPLILNGLKDLIHQTRGLFLVGQASDGRMAVSEYARLRPQVLVTDLSMPEVGGLEVIRAVRKTDPDARIVILSGYGGEEDIYQVLMAGAKAFVMKDAADDVVVECIRVVANGRKYIPTSVASKLAARFDSNQLSPRELEILQLVAAGKSNKHIAREKGLTEGTTKFHLNNIFTKFNVHSRTEAVNHAIRRGIVKL
jgi:two-component system NarL family response regulator